MLKVASGAVAEAFGRTDDETLARAQAGDLGAFTELVHSHQGLVFSLARHFVREPAIAEELAQDVFLDLHRHLHDLASAAHLTFWLRRVTSHRCIDWQRQVSRRREVAAGSGPEPTVAPVARDVIREDRLRRLVSELPPPARLVVILRFQEELEPSAIAGVLDMSVNTVKSHLRRSLATLRERIEDEERL